MVKLRSDMRYENIDFLKGICIMLVVANHLSLPGFTIASLSLFRMPLYYFLSGLFFSRYDSFFTFLIKKTNNLIVPYVFFSLFSLFPFFAFYLFKDRTVEEAYYLSSPLHNEPIWFLVSLYEVGLIMYFVSGIRKIYLQCVLVLFLSVCGYILCKKSLYLPFYLNTALCGIVFYYIGFILRHYYRLLDNNDNIKIKFLMCSVFFLVLSIYIIPGKGISLITCQIQTSYHWFVLAGVGGTLALFYLSKIVEKVKIVNYIGRYSIIVLGTHWYFVKSWKYFIIPPPNIGFFLYLIFAVSILSSLISIAILKRYMPWFTAQKPLISLSDKK